MSRRKPGHGSRGVTVTGGRLDCAASDVTVTKRDGAVALAGVGGRSRRGDGADHIAPLVLAGAGPFAGGADRHAADRGTPLMMRANVTPYASRTQPDQIYRDCNSFLADRRRTSPAGK